MESSCFVVVCEISRSVAEKTGRGTRPFFWTTTNYKSIQVLSTQTLRKMYAVEVLKKNFPREFAKLRVTDINWVSIHTRLDDVVLEAE